jgi:hypothetical protein
VYSQAECLFLLKHYFTLKLFAVILEAFSNAYPDRQVSNKIRIHQLASTFWGKGSVCDKCSSNDKTAI